MLARTVTWANATDQSIRIAMLLTRRVWRELKPRLSPSAWVFPVGLTVAATVVLLVRLRNDSANGDTILLVLAGVILLSLLVIVVNLLYLPWLAWRLRTFGQSRPDGEERALVYLTVKNKLLLEQKLQAQPSAAVGGNGYLVIDRRDRNLQLYSRASEEPLLTVPSGRVISVKGSIAQINMRTMPAVALSIARADGDTVSVELPILATESPSSSSAQEFALRLADLLRVAGN